MLYTFPHRKTRGLEFIPHWWWYYAQQYNPRVKQAFGTFSRTLESMESVFHTPLTVPGSHRKALQWYAVLVYSLPWLHCSAHLWLNIRRMKTTSCMSVSSWTLRLFKQDWKLMKLESHDLFLSTSDAYAKCLRWTEILSQDPYRTEVLESSQNAATPRAGDATLVI